MKHPMRLFWRIFSFVIVSEVFKSAYYLATQTTRGDFFVGRAGAISMGLTAIHLLLAPLAMACLVMAARRDHARTGFYGRTAVLSVLTVFGMYWITEHVLQSGFRLYGGPWPF